MTVENGFIVLGDVSGYGEFIAATELEHRANPQLGALLPKELEDLVLAQQDLDLLLRQLMKGRERLVIGLGAGVLRGGDDVLSDDDDRQQDELEKVRREPVHEHGGGALLDSGGQRDQS